MTCGEASFYARKNRWIRGAEGERVLQEMAMLLLQCEESEEGCRPCQPAPIQCGMSGRARQLERVSFEPWPGHGQNSSADRRPLGRGQPEAVGPPARLP
jgi:hypothetical protein